MQDEKSESDGSTEEAPQVYSVSFDTRKRKFSRREFLEAAALTAAATSLSGCGAVPLFGPTATPTATNTPTPTTTPTVTSTPTPTDTPTITPSPTPVTIVTKTEGVATLRTGPDESFPMIGSILPDVEVLIVARIDGPGWYKVSVSSEFVFESQDQAPKEVVGWVSFDQIVYMPDQYFYDLPEEAPPPTPTPMPNATVIPGEDAVEYEYVDSNGFTKTNTLPCGAQVPEGTICTCNCVTICSCNGYTAPPPCTSDAPSGGGSICTCNLVTYYYPN